MRRIENPDPNAEVKAIILYTKATGTFRSMSDSFIIQNSKRSTELEERPITQKFTSQYFECYEIIS